MINDKKIKIAYIIPALDAGGAERFILDLIKNLNRDIFSPTLVLFSHGGFFVEEARGMGIDVIILQKNFKFDPFNFFKLYQTIKRLKPAIVHTQLGGDIYGRFVACLLEVPVIISTEQNVQTGESFLIRRMKKCTARAAHKIVAISKAVKADTMKRYGVLESKMELIYNGLEIDKFLVSERRPRSKRLIIGSVGRLTAQKNYSLLIDALSDLKDYDFECRLVGEGELRGELEQKIKDLDLGDRVKLLGLQQNIKGFLSDLDVFVLPSLWEGLGIVLLEAGLAGLPVIASRVDGICEVIEDGQTGILFDSGNRADLVSKLKSVLDNQDPEKIMSLGLNLQVDVRTRFGIKIIAKQYQDLYLSLLEQK